MQITNAGAPGGVGGRKEGETGMIVETRTQKDIILDELTRRFTEWGFNPQVANEIIKWGNIDLLKVGEEVEGFRLKMERRSDEDCRREVEITYANYNRTALIWIEGIYTWNNECFSSISELIQNVTDIRLGEADRALCFEARVGEVPQEYRLTYDSLLQKPDGRIT